MCFIILIITYFHFVCCPLIFRLEMRLKLKTINQQRTKLGGHTHSFLCKKISWRNNKERDEKKNEKYFRVEFFFFFLLHTIICWKFFGFFVVFWQRENCWFINYFKCAQKTYLYFLALQKVSSLVQLFDSARVQKFMYIATSQAIIQ